MTFAMRLRSIVLFTASLRYRHKKSRDHPESPAEKGEKYPRTHGSIGCRWGFTGNCTEKLNLLAHSVDRQIVLPPNCMNRDAALGSNARNGWPAAISITTSLAISSTGVAKAAVSICRRKNVRYPIETDFLDVMNRSSQA